MKRKKYSPKLKSKVALAAIKGQKTTNEIGSEFGVHPSQVNRWKKAKLSRSGSLKVFSGIPQQPHAQQGGYGQQYAAVGHIKAWRKLRRNRPLFRESEIC